MSVRGFAPPIGCLMPARHQCRLLAEVVWKLREGQRGRVHMLWCLKLPLFGPYSVDLAEPQ